MERTFNALYTIITFMRDDKNLSKSLVSIVWQKYLLSSSSHHRILRSQKTTSNCFIRYLIIIIRLLLFWISTQNIFLWWREIESLLKLCKKMSNWKWIFFIITITFALYVNCCFACSNVKKKKFYDFTRWNEKRFAISMNGQRHAMMNCIG